MTTPIFYAILIVVSLILFLVIGIAVSAVLGESRGFWISAFITLFFGLIFCIATPSSEQMVENNYYAMLEDRPKCIDTGDTCLGCKKDYIDWQKDSVIKQHKYDSVKVMLDNSNVKNVTTPDVKPDTTVFDTLKTCIEQCWKFAMNSDIKKCQDDCFK